MAPGEHAQVVFQPRPRRNKPNIKKMKNQKKASSAGRFETKLTMEYYRHKWTQRNSKKPADADGCWERLSECTSLSMKCWKTSTRGKNKSGKCEKPADADGCWERSERVHELVHEIFYPVDLHRALLKKIKKNKKIRRRLVRGPRRACPSSLSTTSWSLKYSILSIFTERCLGFSYAI